MCSLENLKSLLHESVLMKNFDNHNVLSILGVGFHADSKLPFLVLPYMVNGDLKTYLQSKRLNEENIDQLPKVCVI